MKSDTEQLNDKQIRKALKSYLSGAAINPKLIVDELSVHNGNARVDVVAFYDYPHSFEIKSDRDNFSRLTRQIAYYDYTFKKNNLVTTAKYIDKAFQHIPKHWGIWLAGTQNESIVDIKCCRKAKINREWSPEKALLTLWKSELVTLNSLITESKAPKSSSRAVLASKLGKEVNKSTLQQNFFEVLFKRFNSMVNDVAISTN